MALSATQVKELEKPLDKSVVASRSQSGRTLSYIEGWHAIAEANRIFGFDGWQRETIEMREVRPAEFVEGNNGKKTWRVGFIAKVRITVGEITREGTGYGSGALPELGEAYESAVKEAETDAMKRALMTFGNPFGLALYDKTQANVTDGEAEKKVEQQQVDQKAIDALFLTIENDLKTAKSVEALTKAWKSHADDLKKMPKGYHEELTSIAADRKSALLKPAREPGDDYESDIPFGDRPSDPRASLDQQFGNAA